ncbi:MAG: hypothetical protein LBK28_08715 [Propionibacteriaceae bacterium]|nr:hypothetical protein [Propionibacteriaceae bacterium]
MAVLSIFADESGDFGTHSDYYIVSLVFHEQQDSLTSHLERLDQSLSDIGVDPSRDVHTGAIIRR